MNTLDKFIEKLKEADKELEEVRKDTAGLSSLSSKLRGLIIESTENNIIKNNK